MEPLLYLLVAIVVALLVIRTWTALFGPRLRRVPSAVVHGTADEVFRDLVLALGGSRQTTVRPVDRRSLWLEWRYIPAWACFVALLAFPVGLIALVARTSQSGSVVVEPLSATESHVRVSGVFHPSALRALDRFLTARTAAARPAAAHHATAR